MQISSPGLSVRSLVEAGRLDEALKLLEARLKVQPDDDEARLQYARILYWKGRLAESERETRDVLSRHPADLEAVELSAQLRLAAGDVRGAVGIYRQMQAMGDNRPEIQQRIVDLLVRAEDTDGVRQALPNGGALTAEQEQRVARVDHPILVDATVGSTWHADQLWPRAEVGAGYRFGRAMTLMAGVYAEQRTFRAVSTVAWSPRIEGLFNAGPLDMTLHVSGSPSDAFLPWLDLRSDLGFGVTEQLTLGLWLRHARYAPTGGEPASPTTIGPNLTVRWGRWALTPGWLFLNRAPGGWNHTAFFKTRLQVDARSALFLWLYFGQDPNFIDRISRRSGAGLTALLGYDRWINGQFGLRVSVSRNQPLGDFDGFTELSVGLRGRL